ncbi:hypothetical protein [Polynucleobacter brandtiae]|uniref:Uncharacterized protein n=1 Tax=Polynucleobacter brandtiae TaxID=1938816 RepID=A0A2M8VH89_9BURK|nr:hypothetical protein [Polynucleobacter brandtiae]PJI76054.1 hypothetical protein B0G85_2043 [Polynucleobacter brandtiae]
MAMLRNTFILFTSFMLSNYSFGQVVSKEFQNNCAREQLSEHQVFKGKSLVVSDFAEYCACQAEYIVNNATKQQVQELVSNPKATPQWLKAIKLKALNTCIASDSKMRT